MGVLDLPIDVIGNFSADMSAKSPINISCVNTPLFSAQKSNSVGEGGSPNLCVELFWLFSNILFWNLFYFIKQKLCYWHFLLAVGFQADLSYKSQHCILMTGHEEMINSKMWKGEGQWACTDCDYTSKNKSNV